MNNLEKKTEEIKQEKIEKVLVNTTWIQEQEKINEFMRYQRMRYAAFKNPDEFIDAWSEE